MSSACLEWCNTRRRKKETHTSQISKRSEGVSLVLAWQCRNEKSPNLRMHTRCVCFLCSCSRSISLTIHEWRDGPRRVIPRLVSVLEELGALLADGAHRLAQVAIHALVLQLQSRRGVVVQNPEATHTDTKLETKKKMSKKVRAKKKKKQKKRDRNSLRRPCPLWSLLLAVL